MVLINDILGGDADIKHGIQSRKDFHESTAKFYALQKT